MFFNIVLTSKQTFLFCTKPYEFHCSAWSVFFEISAKFHEVRSVDVARHMEVSKPSVCHAVATLRDGGFLTMDEDHFLHLTDVGREVAEKIYERHCFFTEQLIAAGVDPKTAEADACRLEHSISDESFSRLKEAAAQDQE